MESELSAARDAVQRAIDETEDADLREHLRSIDEGLETVASQTAGSGTTSTDADVRGDKLESIESEIANVAGNADGVARRHLETARDQLDAYRRTYTRDW